MAESGKFVARGEMVYFIIRMLGESRMCSGNKTQGMRIEENGKALFR